MNFLCENCKQKYHVADEKLRGREVTKFKCKKCEHIIEVRGDAVGAGDDAEPGSASMLSSVPPASAAAPVAPKPSPAPFGAAKPAGTGLPTAGATAPKPAASPAAAKPLGTGFPAAGAAKPATTTGLPTATAKPATSAGLPTAGAPKPATSGLPTTAPRPTAGAAAPRPATGAALPTAGSAARVASPATASPSPAAVTALKPATTAAPAAKPAQQPSALRSSITQTTSHGTHGAHDAAGPKRTTSSASTSALLNPSETGWYAGIREVPVGPLTRAELAAKIDAGDITSDTLVWREGLDDWRPLSAVNELSDLLRESSKRMSDTMLGAQAKKAPSNVVPLSRANTTKDQEEPEESTRLTSLSDLIATAEGGSAHKKPAAKSEPPAAEPKVEAKAPTHEFKSEPKSEPKTEPAVESKPAHDEHLDDAFFMGPSKKAPAAAVAAPAVAAAVAVAAPAPAPAASAANETFGLPTKPAATIASVPPPKQEEKKGGVPMGVVVMMGGLLVLVGGGGLYAGTRINQQQPAVQPPVVQQPAQPATQPTRLDPHVGAQVNLNDQAAQQAAQQPAQQPAQPEQAGQHTAPANGAATAPRANTNGTHASSGSTAARGSTATSTGTTTGLTAAQLAQMQAQLGGAATGGIATSGGGGPVGASARNTPSPSNSEPVAGPTGSVRAGQVLDTFRRTNVVGSCWQQQITRNPAHPPERLNVTLTVNTTGRATAVNVQGANDPALAACIQSRARAQNFGPGGQVDAQANFNLAIGN